MSIHHGFGGVARLRQRLGHHEGHGIADEAHLVGHQRRAVGLQQRRAVTVLQRQSADEGGIVGLLREIGAGPDPEHARHRLGGRGVDAADHPVRVGGAHHPGIGLTGQAEIVGILALAADQGVVFLAADRLPDTVFLQCDSVFQSGGRGLILHERDPKG